MLAVSSKADNSKAAAVINKVDRARADRTKADRVRVDKDREAAISKMRLLLPSMAAAGDKFLTTTFRFSRCRFLRLNHFSSSFYFRADRFGTAHLFVSVCAAGV